MELQILLILITACTGGFIATSYNSIATQKGWTIGELFVNGKGTEPSYVLSIAFFLQYGSVILSAFVNPWWSSLIVLFSGFVLYIFLSSLLKEKSQIASISLMVVSIIALIIYFI